MRLKGRMRNLVLAAAATMTIGLMNTSSALAATPAPTPTPADPFDKMFSGKASNAELAQVSEQIGGGARVVAGVAAVVLFVVFFVKLSAGKKFSFIVSITGAIWLAAFALNPAGTLRFTAGIFNFTS